jgi:hypothetical protein
LLTLVLSASGSQADHADIWAENPAVNPDGLSTPLVELKGVNKWWITQEIPYCLTTDWDTLPTEVSEAVPVWCMPLSPPGPADAG